MKERLSFAVLTLLAAPIVQGAIIQLNSPGSSSASSAVINFDGVPDQTVVNTQYAGQGITFSRTDGQSIPAYDWVSIGRVTTSPNNVIATVSGDFRGGSASSIGLSLNTLFSSPTTEIGAWFGNDLLGLGGYTRTTLEVFDGANLSLGSVFVNTNNN